MKTNKQLLDEFHTEVMVQTNNGGMNFTRANELYLELSKRLERTEKRLCCCIPDQNRFEQCRNLAEYEIWMGDNPTPDDYTDSCAEHLEIMLDDHHRFEVFRIARLDKPAA